jgi:hypothetical protein
MRLCDVENIAFRRKWLIIGGEAAFFPKAASIRTALSLFSHDRKKRTGGEIPMIRSSQYGFRTKTDADCA